MLMHPQTITETCLRSRNRIASRFIYSYLFQHFPRPSSVWKINLHSSESTTKDHLPLPPMLNSLGPSDVVLSVLERALSFFPVSWLNMSPACMQPSPHSFLSQMRTQKKSAQIQDNSEVVFKRPNLDSIFRRLPSRADVCFEWPCRVFFPHLPDRLYLAQIFCKSVLYCSWTALQLHDLKSHYFWTLKCELASHDQKFYYMPC